MINTVVPQETRVVLSGKTVGGGRGKEIDFFSTDGKGNFYWIEVSVSPSPRLPGGTIKSMQLIVKNAINKFTKEKERRLSDYVAANQYEFFGR